MALYNAKDPDKVYKLRKQTLLVIEKALHKKYPAEMSGNVEIDYGKATKMRTLGQIGLIPNALFLPVFLIMKEQCNMSSEVAAKLCKDAYTAGACLDKDECEEAFKGFDYSDFLFDEELKKEYAKLPQHFTIFRGGSIEEYEDEDYGLSWTLDRSCAEFFAFRFSQSQRAVFSREVDKTDIIYFGNDRQESEVIYIRSLWDYDVDLVTKKPTTHIQLWYDKHHKENISKQKPYLLKYYY